MAGKASRLGLQTERRMPQDSQEGFLKKRKVSVVFSPNREVLVYRTTDQEQSPFRTSCSAQDVITETEDKNILP